jgi:proline iminopeptidase
VLRGDIARHYFRTVAPGLVFPDVAAVQCSVLVLAGARDPICPIEDIEEWAWSVPNGYLRFERFDGAGHRVFRDSPDRAFALLRDCILS